ARGLGAGPGALHVGGGLGGLGGIDARIDLVERLALADERAFAEQAALDDPGDLRPDFGHLVGDDAAGQLLLDRRAALLNDDIADRRSAAAPAAAAARAVLRVAAAASDQRSAGNGDRERCP